MKWFEYYQDYCMKFLNDLGLNKDNLRLRKHKPEELVFYSKGTTDIEYKYPQGWGELWGIADRTDYDLTVHSNHSKTDLLYLDPETNEKYTPYVIEPSVGCDRLLLAVLSDAYKEEELPDGTTREVMSFNPSIAPYKVAVLPLIKKYHSEKAEEVYRKISSIIKTTYDDAGNIGKRYRRQDISGTPYCITVDDNTLNDNTVTIRNRDTMEQITLSIEEAIKYIEEKIRF